MWCRLLMCEWHGIVSTLLCGWGWWAELSTTQLMRDDCLPLLGQCTCHDDGRRVGVCDPANDHRQATVRSGGEDDRTARGVVLRAAVHRLARRFDVDQIVQEGECLIAKKVRRQRRIAAIKQVSLR